MLVGKARPIKVEPRRRRWSDPVIPSDWYGVIGQRSVGPQCALCHERQIEGAPALKRGLCGPCWLRTSETDDAA
jgi:cytochrome c5